MIHKSSKHLGVLIDGVLQYSQSDKSIMDQQDDIELVPFFNDIRALHEQACPFELNLKTTLESVHINKSALNQVAMNLISNAIRYNDKDVVKIEVAVHEKGGYYHFSITDNGQGINPKKIDTIFQLFETEGYEDRFGKKGTGIGLSTVQKVITKLGGKIDVTSTLGVGTTFNFTIKIQ